MTYTRIFLAHPKDLEQDEIDMLVAVVQQSDIATPSTVVWSARASFLEFEKDHGKPVNWKRWFDFITSPMVTFGTRPRFDAFVVGPSSAVGKATKDIAGEALRKGIALYRMTPDMKIVKATKVTVLDPTNFKHGWVVS